MYLKQQLNTIVQTCFDNDVKPQDVLEIVRLFYGGHIPAQTTVHELIETIYAVNYDEMTRSDTEARTKVLIETLKQG